ncbi:MAG: S1/P1 nuclease [Candidatus Sericytochromatia bacterium]
MKRSRPALLALFSTAAILMPAAPALAWWDTGHMLTAQIAYTQLTPAARAQADRLIAVLDPMEPDAARRHFVPAAVWMDDTKARGMRAFDLWHYINIPYNPEGLPFVPSAKEDNIVNTFEKMAKTLEHEKASDFEKAFALRVILHLAGDIHQPYHAIGKVSHSHPEGDLGGNLTLVSGVVDIRNAHALWDSTAGLVPQVSASVWQSQIPKLAQDIQNKYPASSFQQSMEFNPMVWAQESYRLAVTHGYEKLPASGPIPQSAVQEAQTVCGRQIALGGYRLAALLNAKLK